MKQRRDSGSINWLAILGEGIDSDTANALIKKEKLTVKPIEDNYFAPTRYSDYYNKNGNIAYLQNGEYVLVLYYVERKEQKQGKRVMGYAYTPKKYSVKLNEDEGSAANGKQAFEYINNALKEKHGKTFRVIFGNSCECRDCIPAPLNYGRISPDTYYSFYKVDASSAYATEACKPLPTMKGSKTVYGSHKPTAEYPFAFYPKEGKLAIYGESKYAYDVPLIAEYTLLCPAAPVSLAPIMEELYAFKEAAEDKHLRQYYKDIMNYFVGWLHWRPKNKKTGKYAVPGDAEYDPNCPRYAAVAAVVKARCNARMLDLRDEIEAVKGNEMVLINTDAIGWTGHDMPHIYTKVKALGSLLLEHKDASAIILGSKRYQILDRDGTLTTKWAGVRRETTKKMKWGDIHKDTHTLRIKVWDWKLQQIVYKTKEELNREEKVQQRSTL